MHICFIEQKSLELIELHLKIYMEQCGIWVINPRTPVIETIQSDQYFPSVHGLSF